jgi:copper chaperone for superoxide dismutase
LIEAGALATIVADASGRARLQVEAPRLSVDDIIGRSVVLRSEADQSAPARVSCAVVARSAGAQQNDKRLCLCDGTTIWESKATTQFK